MKKPLLAAIGAAALVPAIAGATTTTYYSGQLCQIADNAAVTDRGLTNWDFLTHHTYCGASWSTSASNGQGNAGVALRAATLVYTDNSSGSFDCHVIQENWDGSIYSSYSLYSCPQYGGCQEDSDPGWQGGGQLNWTTINASTLYPTTIAVACSTPGNGSTIRGYNFSLD